jgi:putative transposase
MSNEPITNDFNQFHRNLPHWQQGGSSYFITFRSAIGILPKDALLKVKDHILFDHGRRYTLYFGVIMPDHVHLIIQPLKKSDDEWFGLSQIMYTLKGISARSINKLLNKTGQVWQHESFDRIIRSEDELYEKWKYMWNNPIKAGLSDGLIEYQFYVKPS